MRIRWFDRLLLVLASLFLLIEGVVLGLLALNIGRPTFHRWVDLMFGHTINQVILCVVAVALLLIGLRLLLLRSRKPREDNMIFMCTTEAGTIRILPDAVEAIVQRSARNNAHVRDLKTRIMPVDGSLHVQLRVMLSPGANVKDISVELQAAVKDELEKNTGIPVPEVQVIVEATPAPTAARVDT